MINFVTETEGIDAVAEERKTVGSAIHEVYRDDLGHARMETWSIEGFAHAVPIDSDGDPEICGVEAEFIMNANLCAIRRIANFWHLQ